MIVYGPDGVARYPFDLTPSLTDNDPVGVNEIVRGPDGSVALGGQFIGPYDFDFSDGGERVLDITGTASAYVAAYDRTAGAPRFASSFDPGL